MTRRPLRSAPPAYLFFGAFAGDPDVLDRVRRAVEARYGPLHPRGVSPTFPFPDTETYRETMGTGLLRRFYVIARRWPQDGLAPVKRSANEMEDAIRKELELERATRPASRPGPDEPPAGSFPMRPVNIDPGLINDCRIILATTKDHAHRIYRGDGIWEEVTLIYTKGAYRRLPWTYRDFENPGYHEFFATFREELIHHRAAPHSES